MRVILFLLFLGLCCGHPALHHSGSLTTQSMDPHLSILGKRDGTTLCLVVPQDGTDQSLLNRLEESIKSATGLSDIHSWSTDGELMWYHVHLTQTEVKNLEENSDVAYVEIDEETETHEAPPEDDDWAADRPGLYARSIFERDQQYATQENAATELLVISTPPDRDYSCYDDYTYPKEAGKGIYVYHIEDGIQKQYSQEFDGRIEEPLKLPLQEKFPQSPTAHSTCAAEKALGTKYGVAKEAKYVPVLYKMPSAGTIAQGFKAVIDDLQRDKDEADKNNRQPERYGKSLVILTSGLKKTFNELPLDKKPYTLIRQYMASLINMGAPIVASAGNRANPTTGDVEVNTLPAWYASGSILPVINVGSATADGEVTSTSRRGDKVSIYANGYKILCSGQTQSGTSFTAPQVGGGIAVGMSQTEGSFYEATHGKQGKEFVKAVRHFIMTQSSWKRPGGVNMFWNMANDPKDQRN